MIIVQSRLFVADNTGARQLMCIRIVGNKKRAASVGDVIVGVIKKALPAKKIKKAAARQMGQKNLAETSSKKAEIALAVVIRAKTFLRREEGSFLSFDENASALIKPDKNPRGTRIFGPVSIELRKRGFAKLVSMSSDLV